jgi:sporulation protein YlmC with PRC-barrel domain
MVRRLFAAGVIAAAFATTSPVMAQPAPPPSESAKAALVGLAVYSSDGQRLGKVTHARLAGNQQVVRAEFGNFLGIEPIAVIIPATSFVQKVDRIEMRMTAAEVKDQLAEQQQQQRQRQERKE